LVVSEVLLERESELARVDGLLSAARAGRGSVALVTGPSGVGKSSLLGGWIQRATDCDVGALCVRGDELVMESPFAAVRELLWSEVRVVGGNAWVGAAELARPVFESTGEALGDRDRRAAVLHGLYWLVAGMGERCARILVVDDAQWLDLASARFVVYLARRIESLPVVLAVGLRDGEPRVRSAALEGLVEMASVSVRVEPLSEAASAVLVRRRLGPRADEELCRSCHAATGGNPFFLRELTVALAAMSGRPGIELANRVRELGAGAIGRSVRVRIARLGSDCETLAVAAAILGPGCGCVMRRCWPASSAIARRRRRMRCARPTFSRAGEACRLYTRLSASP
jgi:AAA ATPase domain